MGSSVEAASTMMKKLMHPKIKKPAVESLKVCVGLMTKIQHMTFDRKYGKILHLLEVDVQIEAITALCQFYDSPMRCFTFQDFQMAPTLEEFVQILGYSLENVKPYRYWGHYPSLQAVAGVLRVQVKELQDKKQNRNGFEGFPLKYLEERLGHLAKMGDWSSFMDVLALVIYGVLLFPHIDEYIDFAAIDVFLAFKDRGESPVPAILADTYYTFTHCYERKGKKILCCLPTLYVWLVTHMFDNKCKVTCPIGDFKMCYVKVKSNREWAQRLVDLNEKTVRWYPKWQEINEVIYQCGVFPNVPLMGTKGCINYNPALVLRQLGYPMMEPPSKEMTSPLFLFDMGLQNLEEIQNVREAWDKVIRKSSELGKRSCGAKENYRQWLKERIQKVKLPFHCSIPVPKEAIDETPISFTISPEEVEELRAALLKSEEEKMRLQGKLEEVQRENKALQLENTQKELDLDKANKRAKVEGKYNFKTQDCLKATNKELELRGQERDKAWIDAQHWKELWSKSKTAERSLKRQFEDLNQQLEKVVAEYEKRVKIEKQYSEEVEGRNAEYRDAIKREQENACELRSYIEGQERITNELKSEGIYWKDCFTKLANRVEDQKKQINEFREEGIYWMDRCSKLVWLANQAIKNVPRLLRAAEGMINPLSTPVEISRFIESCKDLISEMNKLCKSD